MPNNSIIAGFVIWLEGLLLPFISSNFYGIEIINVPISLFFFAVLTFANFIVESIFNFSNLNIIISWILLFLLLIFFIKMIEFAKVKIGNGRTVLTCLGFGLMCLPTFTSNFLTRLSFVNFVSF
jgi:hypothetical protein